MYQIESDAPEADPSLAQEIVAFGFMPAVVIGRHVLELVKERMATGETASGPSPNTQSYQKLSPVYGQAAGLSKSYYPSRADKYAELGRPRDSFSVSGGMMRGASAIENGTDNVEMRFFGVSLGSKGEMVDNTAKAAAVFEKTGVAVLEMATAEKTIAEHIIASMLKHTIGKSLGQVEQGAEDAYDRLRARLSSVV